MGGYKNHIIASLLLVVLVSWVLMKIGFTADFRDLVFCVILSVTYSLLPDLDIPTSRIRRLTSRLLLTSSLSCLILVIQKTNITLLLICLASTLLLYFFWSLRHRGFLHTLHWAFIMSLPLGFFNLTWFLFAFTGYFSHLLVDRQII
ncbi:MAG: hypothetical protein GF334_09975 [Candidatus Altiarchaeales archaeon]|nr:hypothetical protein [Candidatus Altiarchaeales archaeon]